MGIINRDHNNMLKGEGAGLMLKVAAFTEQEKINYFLIRLPFDRMLSQWMSLPYQFHIINAKKKSSNNFLNNPVR